MKKQLLILTLLALTAIPASFAQVRTTTTNNCMWLNYTQMTKFNKGITLHTELQWRRLDWGMHPEQVQLRVGVLKDLGNATTFGLGYSFISTSRYGEFSPKSAFDENRIYEQLQHKSTFGKFEWVNRMRLEQRFINDPVADANGIYSEGPAVLKHRARWSNRISFPLNKKTIENGAFYLTAFDEVFIGFGGNVPLNIFDQNRAYAGIGYKHPVIGKIEVGFMEQIINKSKVSHDVYTGREEFNNTLCISIYKDLDLTSK